MEALKNNKGKIILNKVFIDTASIDVLEMLFANFFPISIVSDYLYIYDRIVYYGYSKHFEESKEGEKVPEYEVYFTSNKKGIVTSIEFKKVVKQ
ncbi:hypothetical protein [Thalassobellus suaedae]|uniref:Uncharacterized protein n=1 Tax=Thalassobellus suaedae TaxID=3074124 RepID=A0ABY9XVL1_9FLAO|nr:hypothetical protein RHP51_04715 [Flavobacteriaceae bacterium HL-DH14]